MDAMRSLAQVHPHLGGPARQQVCDPQFGWRRYAHLRHGPAVNQVDELGHLPKALGVIWYVPIVFPPTRSSTRLSRFDPRGDDHVAPALALLLKEFRGLGRRCSNRSKSKVPELL